MCFSFFFQHPSFNLRKILKLRILRQQLFRCLLSLFRNFHMSKRGYFKLGKTRCAISEAHITYGRRKAFPRGFCDCRVTDGIAYIELERPRLCEQFVVHELAHVIAWPSDHGPAFVSALLDLTHYVFWPGARAQLRQWMRDEGVKMR